jgi:hypothetical protein
MMAVTQPKSPKPGLIKPKQDKQNHENESGTAVRDFMLHSSGM